MKKSVAFLLIYNPINVCALVNEQLHGSRADSSDLEAIIFFQKSKNSHDQRGLIKVIWLIYFCSCVKEQLGHFVVGSSTGGYEGRLFVGWGLQVYIDILVSQEELGDLGSPCLSQDLPMQEQ